MVANAETAMLLETIPEQQEIRLPESEIQSIAVASINAFAQQRAGRNEKQEQLTKSIREVGMVNAVNVAYVDRASLEEYLAFTNRVWMADRTMDNFVPIALGSQTFAVLIAGHSRIESHRTIAEEDGIKQWNYFVDVRIHEVSSVDEIVKIQLAENIHSAPPPDRAARAYAEAFLWAREKNPKLSKAEFARTNGITPGSLTDALNYAELPPTVREMTDDGALPFSVSVELARAMPWIEKDVDDIVAKKYGTTQGDEAEQLWAEIMTNEFARFIVHFNETSHVTNTRMMIPNHAKGLKEKYSDVKSEVPDLEMVMFDARDYGADRQKFLRREIVSSLQAVQDSQYRRTRLLHERVVELTGMTEFAIDPKPGLVAVEMGRLALEA